MPAYVDERRRGACGLPVLRAEEEARWAQNMNSLVFWCPQTASRVPAAARQQLDLDAAAGPPAPSQLNAGSPPQESKGARLHCLHPNTTFKALSDYCTAPDLPAHLDSTTCTTARPRSSLSPCWPALPVREPTAAAPTATKLRRKSGSARRRAEAIQEGLAALEGRPWSAGAQRYPAVD